MKLRNKLIIRPIIAVLAIAMLGVALACAGEEAAPTSEPEATSVPPTATSPPVPGGVQPTATPVEQVGADVAWMDRYLQSPWLRPGVGPAHQGRDVHIRGPTGRHDLLPQQSGLLLHSRVFPRPALEFHAPD